MKVRINGESKEIPDGLTVDLLLAHLGLASARVAVERNLDILPRDQWPTTQVQPHDRYEIVHFVGGGHAPR